MDHLARVTIASRVFGIATVLGLAALAGEPEAFQSTLVLAIVAAAAIYVSLATSLSGTFVISVEVLVAGLVIGLALPDGLILLPYLVVLPLIAGMSRGLIGVSAVVLAEILSIVLLPAAFGDLENIRERAEILAPWLLTGLGTGFLGTLLKQLGRVQPPHDVDPTYASARRLLTQLRTVARRLSAGLDAPAMSTQLLSVVHDSLQDTHSAVFVRTDGGVLTPLCYRGDRAREMLLPDDAVIEKCWAEAEPSSMVSTAGEADRRYRTALPLRTGTRMIGIVLTASPRAPQSVTLSELMREVDEHSMRIDTALAFDEVRTLATADERQRLAREIHDGIAQEVASLGYAVDDLVARATDGTQARKLRDLRRELTRMVGELRLSIFDLRSEIGPGAGLGAALSDYVRQVGARSTMTVHLTLDEAPTRLTSGVETELFRIAQEAITNARKHSEARNLWVNCRVQPPFARLEIRDDGCGLQQGREDSYGLQIMQERATRLGADLCINAETMGGAPRGTLVTVELGRGSVDHTSLNER